MPGWTGMAEGQREEAGAIYLPHLACTEFQREEQLVLVTGLCKMSYISRAEPESAVIRCL